MRKATKLGVVLLIFGVACLLISVVSFKMLTEYFFMPEANLFAGGFLISLCLGGGFCIIGLVILAIKGVQWVIKN